MSRRSQESPLVESRYLGASILVMVVCSILVIRLWYIQVYRGEYYVQISENNRIRRIEIPAPRGMVFDRHGEVILGNRPFYDLVYIPQYIKEREKTLNVLANLLHMPAANLDRMLHINTGRPEFLPVTIKRNLSDYEVSLIESNKVFLPGIEVNVAPRRDYQADTPAHMVGYMGEIDAQALRVKNEEDPDNPYLPGDLIGKHGLESRWENVLRGKRGYRYIQVDAFGRQTSLFEKEGWELPIKPAQPGADLILTIDFELQKVAAKAFQGKFGAVVVMNPQNGEILAMVSSPSFDPTMYQDGVSHEKWQALINDPFKPLYDKATGGVFAPGSVYKVVVALAGLEEGLIDAKKSYYCPGSFELGRDVFHCWNRKGHGKTDLQDALKKSCDVFFYNLGLELGIDRIAKYANALGLGSKLGIELNREDTGFIPSSIKKIGKRNWVPGDVPSISIGQGANLLTPMQIASLYATIANGGHIWRPYIVKRAVNHVGESVFEQKPELVKNVDIISEQHFKLLQKLLEGVVDTPDGTGRSAKVKGISVAGKTASVQVVSLKKNRSRETSVVSMKWQEHSMFAAFTPSENAEMTLAVVSENDTVGGGGMACAPIARQIIEAYWDLKKKRAGAQIATKPDGASDAKSEVLQ